MAQQGLDLAKYPVLVVDDESDNLDAFRFNFGRSFKLLLASSGEEALALARSEDVAAIVTDQRMPKMTGLELLKAAREVRPDAVGIIVTAFTDVDVLIEAINLGRIYRYVTKPWDSKELRGVLTHAVERFSLVRENRRLAEQLRRTSACCRTTRTASSTSAPSSASRRRCARCSRASSRWRRRRRRCCCAARPAPARSWSRARSTSTAPRESRAVRARQLRRAGAGLLEMRAVRPREGRLHRRDGAAAGPLRAGRRRHAVPRRGRRPAAGRAGQAAARAAGARVRARRRQRDDQGRRARRGGDPPRPREADRRRRRSARTSTTGSTCSRSTCRRCASALEDIAVLAEHFVAEVRAAPRASRCAASTPSAIAALARLPLAGQRARARERHRARADPGARHRDHRGRPGVHAARPPADRGAPRRRRRW